MHDIVLTWLLWPGSYGACDIHFTCHILPIHGIQDTAVSMEMSFDGVVGPSAPNSDVWKALNNELKQL